MSVPNPIAWCAPYHGVRILDQTLLPLEERYLELASVAEVGEAIRALRVRGAPLIGIAAAMGVVQALRDAPPNEPNDRALGRVRAAASELGATRPTAVNLQWALARMVRRAVSVAGPVAALREALVAEATAIREEDRAMCERIGAHGAPLLAGGATVCTVCNAGVLATGGIGTALAPIYTAHREGRRLQVVVPETRPLLQGSRLTAWELARSGVPATVITDGMVASRLSRGDVSLVLVGADRIAANGDVVNKIGTYGLALAARAHGIPFYVAAPSSTLDLATPSGARVPIEERSPDEVTGWQGHRAAPAGVSVWNPAFDVTPAELVTAVITDRGVFAPAELA